MSCDKSGTSGQKKQRNILSFFPTDEKGVKLEKPNDEEEDETVELGIKCPEWTEVNRDNLNISYAVVLSKASCQKMFDKLEEEIEYFQGELAMVKVFGKCHPIPRQQSAYGDPGLSYKYSGTAVPALAWTNSLAQLRDLVQRLTGWRWISDMEMAALL